MRIVQTVFGVFHHFDLARQLDARGHQDTVFSTWPWKRLEREGLPRSQVKTFPWIHTPEFVLRRANLLPRWIDDVMGYANALAFDEYTLRNLPECDALIGISGSSLKTGKAVQDRGGIFVCDRGSTHQRFQEQLVAGEFKRWNIDRSPSDIRDTVREEAIYDMCDAIAVPSTFSANSFITMGIPRNKIHVIPYGVRLEKFSPVCEPPPIHERFELIFAGQISLRKGLPYLFQAFAELKHPRKRLRVAGHIHDSLRPLLRKLPLENVEFLGGVPQHELVQLMSSSHLFVLPSIEEGLALVQGQALASGCPVLATSNSGSEDLFTDNVEGFIVPIRDPAALRNRMEMLIETPGLHARMRSAALKRVSHLGGWNQYGDQWEKLLFALTQKSEPDYLPVSSLSSASHLSP